MKFKKRLIKYIKFHILQKSLKDFIKKKEQLPIEMVIEYNKLQNKFE